jgi:hypothetical protein
MSNKIEYDHTIYDTSFRTYDYVPNTAAWVDYLGLEIRERGFFLTVYDSNGDHIIEYHDPWSTFAWKELQDLVLNAVWTEVKKKSDKMVPPYV